MAPYIPRQGDLIALSFDPQAGHEQKGRRPAIVVSKTLFNERTGLCICCPITTTRRGYPFHVEVPEGLPVNGVVMCEQVKSIDHRAWSAGLIAHAPHALPSDVLAVLDACF